MSCLFIKKRYLIGYLKRQSKSLFSFPYYSKKKPVKKGSLENGSAAQMSGDGSIYHVYESMDQATGNRLSAPYQQTGDGSIPPPNGYPAEAYPSPAPDTLRSTPGYLMEEESPVHTPPPDYPMDSLQSGANRDSQYDTNRWMKHVHDQLHTTRWSQTLMSNGSVPYSHAYSQRSDSPHSEYSQYSREPDYSPQTEAEYLGYSEDEQDIAHNPLYGKSHDLFFAY